MTEQDKACMRRAIDTVSEDLMGRQGRWCVRHRHG